MPLPGVLRRPSGRLAPPGVPRVDATDSINAGLASCWLLSQTLKDVSGLDGTASQVGATPARPSLTPLGLMQTTGSGQFFDLPSEPIIWPSMSISFWFRATAQVTSEFDTLFSQGSPVSNIQPRFFDCRFDVVGNVGPPYFLTFLDYDGSSTQGALSTLDLNAAANVNKLFHVVGTSDGTTAQIFINGQFNASGVSHTLGNSLLPFNVGYSNQNGSTSRIFTGNIDNIRTYSRVLASGEVARLYVDPWAGLVFPSGRLPSVLRSPAAAAAFLPNNQLRQWAPVLAQ